MIYKVMNPDLSVFEVDEQDFKLRCVKETEIFGDAIIMLTDFGMLLLPTPMLRHAQMGRSKLSSLELYYETMKESPYIITNEDIRKFKKALLQSVFTVSLTNG